MSGSRVIGEGVGPASSRLARVPMQTTRGCLVASIQTDLDEATLGEFRCDLLERIRHTAVAGVILDVSAVVIMDAHDFDSLKRTMEMAAVMGATPIIVGLRPGIVAALVELDTQVDAVRTALDVDHAFELIARGGP